MTHCARLPDTATAGLSFAPNDINLDKYPAPDWALVALIRGPQSIDLTATANGTLHTFAAAATTTAAWQPGEYWYTLRASNAGDIVEVHSGTITIKPDFASIADGYDGRTPNRVALDSIEAVLAKRATQDQQRYSINNRELWRTAIPDLIKLRTYYRALVRNEEGRKTFGTPLKIRFNSR